MNKYMNANKTVKQATKNQSKTKQKTKAIR